MRCEVKAKGYRDCCDQKAAKRRIFVSGERSHLTGEVDEEQPLFVEVSLCDEHWKALIGRGGYGLLDLEEPSS